MLFFATAALASAANVGNMAWPCTRLNWGWRNVWSTCSINSYVPTNAAGADHPPAFFRKLPLDTTAGPATAVNAEGIFTPAAASQNAQVPQMLCNAMPATHGGSHVDFSRLRSRCRRAIDAYGGLVRVCSMTTAQGAIRGPVASSNYHNWEPLAQHQPHVLNVQALTTMAHKCVTDVAPHTWMSPSTTCPGLLGWWGVVWTACGFKAQAPVHNAAELVSAPILAPLGSELSPRFFLGTTALGAPPNDATGPSFIFCSPIATASPSSWNARGAAFRTSRCRRALDQFGRTARRCGGTAFPSAADAPTRGSADPLRALVVGTAAANSPRALGNLAPLCN